MISDQNISIFFNKNAFLTINFFQRVYDFVAGGYDGVTSLGLPTQRKSLIGCIRRIKVDDVRIHPEKHRVVSPNDDVISFCGSA